MSTRPSDSDYRRMLAFREGLRRFLHWSEQQALAVGVTPAHHQLLLAIRGHGRFQSVFHQRRLRIIHTHCFHQHLDSSGQLHTDGYRNEWQSHPHSNTDADGQCAVRFFTDGHAGVADDNRGHQHHLHGER